MIYEVVILNRSAPILDFSYHLEIEPGTLIQVKLQGSLCNAIILKCKPNSKYKLVSISLVSKLKLLGKIDLQFLLWVSKYYIYSVSELFNSILPGYFNQHTEINIKQARWFVLKNHDFTPQNAKQAKAISLLKNGANQAQLMELVTKKRIAIWLNEAIITLMPDINTHLQYELTPQQRDCFNSIDKEQDFKVQYLYGLTGSGKTEVYIHLIAKALQKGKQVLLLIPEINLTKQFLAKLSANFSGEIYTYNSKVSAKEKATTWVFAMQNQVKLCVATRSGIFLPLNNLGLIIVDEEHNSSYKQNDKFCYNARDLAIKKAQLQKCKIVLGSATPAIESYYNVITQKYQMHKLMQRVKATKAPSLNIVTQTHPVLNPKIVKSIIERLKAKEQVIILINKKGYAGMLKCESCNYKVTCSGCDKNFTFYKKDNLLVCNRCKIKTSAFAFCPKCKFGALKEYGTGTEKILEFLASLPYPKLLFDADHLSSKTALKHQLDTVNQGNPLIIVGTQMISTGHDFKHVGLVCIIEIDHSFYASEYFALEKIGQLIVQTSGRGGRHALKGEIIIQTKEPKHEFFEKIHADYLHFLDWILQDRKIFSLPPFSQIAIITARHKQEDKAKHALISACKNINKSHKFGPYPAIIEKINEEFRYQTTIFAPSKSKLFLVLQSIVLPKNIKCSIDVHPADSR